MTITRRDFAKATLGAVSLAAMGTRNAVADDIITKSIPSSGEKVPVVGLGTNRYGVGASESARAPLRAALARFHELGGTVIDTAPSYRSSETVLGDLTSELGINNDLFVATKTDKDTVAATEEQMRASAAKLKTGRLDLMQVHSLRDWKTSLPVMREWKQDDRIRYIGITTSRYSQFEEMEAIMREQELDFIQVNYSLEQRDAAKRILPLAIDRGIAVIVNLVFGRGRIFNAVGDNPLPYWALEFDCSSWAQFLLKYAIGHPAVTLSIPGMTKLHHVDDNLGALQGRLPNASERLRQESFYDSL